MSSDPDIMTLKLVVCFIFFILYHYILKWLLEITNDNDRPR
jgi:hypothetical protein